MLLEMFVNELSLVPAAVDVQTGQGRARQLVLTMKAAAVRGVKRTLRIPEDFFAKPIAPGYTFHTWLNDGRVEREVRQYLRSLTTKAPFLHDQLDAEAAWAKMDCYCQNEPALGLKAAFVSDGLALSMSSGPEWNCTLVVCEIQEIESGDVSCHNESIHHASSPDHLSTHTDWIQQRIQDTVADGKDLWYKVGDFFPSLEFCLAVEEQMAALPPGSIPSITRGLVQLNLYSAGWQTGAFKPEQIGCAVSPEAQTTVDRFGAERTFLCPDGRPRVFNWHAKVGYWRIYFDPTPGPGHLLVGYVGKHLRTAKFK